MKIISTNHPGVPASCTGDTSVYSNIYWYDSPISEEVLDAEHIPILKEERNTNIDEKTHELITNGFIYASNVFSLSPEAQINWIALKQAVDSGLLTLPVNITTKDDLEYTISDTADLINFYGTGLVTKKAHIDSGRDLKILINAAVDETSVNSIEDTR